MDNTTLLRIRKLFRYVRLYGAGRTLAKVRAERHMRRHYRVLPPVGRRTARGKHVAIIGCGKFAFSTIAWYLHKKYGPVIRAAMDVDIHRAASLYDAYRLLYYTDDAQRIMDDSDVDLVYVVSNHSSHAEYAVRALAAGKSVHIEKPHVVNREQLVRLCRAMGLSSGKVTLGFNRPLSRLGVEIRERLAAQSGAAVLNWSVVGHPLPGDHWYRREDEGGRVLGNLCHWSDFLYQMVPEESRYPITIRGACSKKAECAVAVTYEFGDGSVGVVSLSANGPTFEGVRERFTAQRGDVIVAMDDFQSCVVDEDARKWRWKTVFRDQGHEASVRCSYGLVRPDGRGGAGCPVEYVWETGELFLGTGEALESGREVTVEQYTPDVLSGRDSGEGR